MKNLIFLTLALFGVLSGSYAQEWIPYNDTLVYFYRASDTGDYFTLRTKTKTVTGDETKIHFTDNYIPCDTAEAPGGWQLYYAKNGSVLGDSLVVVGDTIWMDNNAQFLNNMVLGETRTFSIIEGTEITFISQTDTLIFDIPDSVKYYEINDGTQLIQSKNFGFVYFPKQNSDLSIHYQLVGIDNFVGLNFDHHNEIFDFEIGDKFSYYNSYFSVFYEIWDGYNSRMEVLDKYEIDNKYYYDVIIDGDYIINYPRTVLGNPSYDYPGERVNYCRGCDGINNVAMDYILEDELAYHHLFNLGHRYGVSPETGHILQVVGHGKVRDSYTTFGSGEKIALNTQIDYEFYPLDGEELLRIAGSDSYAVIYEEGLGMVYFQGSIGEMGHFRKLIGAIKAGDTLGTVYTSLDEEQLIPLNLFPNPATNWLYFDQQLKSVGVFDISGKQVLLFENSVSQIDVSQLEPGSYIILATTLMDEKKWARVIKT